MNYVPGQSLRNTRESSSAPDLDILGVNQMEGFSCKMLVSIESSVLLLLTEEEEERAQRLVMKSTIKVQCLLLQVREVSQDWWVSPVGLGVPGHLAFREGKDSPVTLEETDAREELDSRD